MGRLRSPLPSPQPARAARRHVRSGRHVPVARRYRVDHRSHRSHRGGDRHRHEHAQRQPPRHHPIATAVADTRTFEVVLRGNSRSLARAFARAQKDSNDFGQRVQRVARAASTAAAGLGVALGTAAVKGAVNLEKGLREVQTLLPNLSDKGFAKMRREVLALSDEMGIATDQAVPALYSAISAGVPPDNVMSFLETASKTAIGGVTSLETATDALTTVTNTWGKTAGVTAAKAADVLFTTVKLGKTTMEELGGSINQVAGLASAFGIEFEQVTAGVTELTKAGVPTTEAMTKMRALIQSISSPSMRAASAFKELGIEVSAARTAQEGILPVVQELMDKTAGNDTLQRKLFGSVEALQAAMVLTTNAGAGYTATLDAMRNASGAADAAFNTMNESAARQFEIVKVQLSNALTELGTKILPHLVEALGWVVDNMDLLLPATAGVTAAMAALAVVLAVNPVGLVVIAIGALTAAFVVAWRRSETFRDIVRGVFNVVVGVVEIAVATILTYFGLWVTALSKIADAVGWLADKVGIDMSGVTDAIGDAATWFADTAVGLFESGGRRIADSFDHWGKEMRWNTSQYADDARRAIETSMDTAVAVTDTTTTEIEQTWWSHYQTLQNERRSHAEQLDRIISMDHDAQRAAIESHHAGMVEIARQAQEQEHADAVAHHERLAALQTGWAGQYADAQRARVMGLKRWAAGASEYHRQTTEAATTAAAKTLSEAERLAAGLLVTMRNACGTVTGFKQCVDGMVVEFDADMNRIVDSANDMKQGLASSVAAANAALASLVPGSLGSAWNLAQRQDVASRVGSGTFIGIAAAQGGLTADQIRRKAEQEANILQRRREGREALNKRRELAGLPPLPALAAGGIVRARPGGTLAIIGEGRYDEAVVPLKGKNAMGGPTINLYFTIEGSVLTERDLKEITLEAVNEGLRSGDVSAAYTP
ncbi:MAG: phage tail tape measure protein [Acidobacteria bacterium]|nr:phage tail tape measure protein [Acidobacteriota bacterium]